MCTDDSSKCIAVRDSNFFIAQRYGLLHHFLRMGCTTEKTKICCYLEFGVLHLGFNFVLACLLLLIIIFRYVLLCVRHIFCSCIVLVLFLFVIICSSLLVFS